MHSSCDKLAPSHPFTLADVEVMRAMRLRHTRRKFRLIIALQVVLSILIVLWTSYIVTSYITSKNPHLQWTNDWIILVSVLLIVVNIASVVVTVNKYKATLHFLKDPTTHPDLILSGEMSFSGSKPAQPQKHPAST